MKVPFKLLRGSAIAGVAFLLATPALAADIDVTISGINSTSGRIMCRVFNERSGFPIRGALQTVHGAIAEGTSRCRFSDLPEGRYAIAVLHDANSNDKLDKSFIGLPTEGLAFSETGKPAFGVPSFSSAAFRLGADGSRLSLRMSYP